MTAEAAAPSPRDAARGYSVRRGRLALAYAIEIIVIVASLAGAYLFARQYGEGRTETIVMMMLAPIGYAAIEFCRVPLAFSARTQSSWIIKTLAVIAVICAAGVTIKSMSQLGEIMFRPRLQEVKLASHELNEAIGRQRSIKESVAAAEQDVANAQANLDHARQGSQEATAAMVGLPRAQCFPVSRRTADGRLVRSQVCREDSRVALAKANLEDKNGKLSAAQQAFDNAEARRRSFAPRADEIDNEVVRKKKLYEEAVFRSQLHSFTAMVFGKDPQQVSDGEIAQFLRVFVFFPAIFVSFAATMLAATSVDRIKPRKDAEPITLPDQAGQYILGPFAQSIIEEATRRVIEEQRASVPGARGAPQPAAGTSAEPVRPPPAANAAETAAAAPVEAQTDAAAAAPSDPAPNEERREPVPGTVTPLRRV